METIASLTELLAYLEQEGTLRDLLNDPTAQFGTGEVPYLGATLLPERRVEDNVFREQGIKYKTFLAQAGSYYSPAQLNTAGEIVGSFLVELGKNDQADQVTAQTYKTLMALLRDKRPRDALLAATRWFDFHILRPHLDLDEKYRWDAIIKAMVTRRGSNGYLETVDYPNPPGHRPPPIPSGTVATPTGWYDTSGSYDPFEDVFAVADMMSRKGYSLSRILTGSRKIPSVLGRNPVVRERTSSVTFTADGDLSARPGRATATQINGYLGEESIPPIEIYNKTYFAREGNGSKEYLYIPDNVLVFIGGTQQTEVLDLGQERGVLELENTLGYYALGTTAQDYRPGRTTNIEERNLYPGGMYAEAVSLTLPVIMEPEAIAILTINPPTP